MQVHRRTANPIELAGMAELALHAATHLETIRQNERQASLACDIAERLVRTGLRPLGGDVVLLFRPGLPGDEHWEVLWAGEPGAKFTWEATPAFRCPPHCRCHAMPLGNPGFWSEMRQADSWEIQTS